MLLILLRWLTQSGEQGKLFRFPKKPSIFGIFVTLLSVVEIKTLPANFQMENIEMESDNNLIINLNHISLLDFSNTYLHNQSFW